MKSFCGTAASRAAFTPDTVSIKGSEAYRDFDNVTDGYKFLNSTYVRNDVPAQSLVVTVCDHRAGVTNGKCNNCGAEVAAAAVTDAAGVTTGYGSFEEAVNAAARLDGSTVTPNSTNFSRRKCADPLPPCPERANIFT